MAAMRHKNFCVYQRRTWDEYRRGLSVGHASQPVERAENLEYRNQLSGVCWGAVYCSIESIFLNHPVYWWYTTGWPPSNMVFFLWPVVKNFDVFVLICINMCIITLNKILKSMLCNSTEKDLDISDSSNLICYVTQIFLILVWIRKTN